MIINYFPYDYVEDVGAIDYLHLYEVGYRGLIFDIDNTLVAHGKDSTPEVDAFLGHLHEMGFKTLLLSNNSQERVRRFCRNIDTLYIADAHKPSPAGFREGLEMLGLPAEKVVVVGDTTFTDIVGANRAGIKSILVKYIGYYDDEPKGIKRGLERMMLSLYPLVRRCGQKTLYKRR